MKCEMPTMDSVARFKAAMDSDKGALGPFMIGTDPAFVESAGHAGYDFVLLDMEHGTTTFETLPHLIRAANVAGVCPVVRVPRGSDIWIDQALDVGAGGVMIPQIDTAEQARAAVSAAKFSPVGTRGTCRFVRSAGFGAVPIPMELVMGAIFILFLILFAGRTGVRAVLSFFLTVLAIWKLLVPLYLKGYNPIWTGLVFTLLLSVLIIALVYGFDRRCVSAVSGTFLGILVTCLLGSLFTDLFQIHGAVMSSSESLLYAGYQDLNLTRIFMASIFIGASGALMDLSVDITSAVHEVVEKRPDIGWKEAVRSGMNVGRSAMGTMTTTLLLAYSGGYIALLMVFMAQGTPLVNILNYKHVAAEMVHTVIGSFGLVTVAPFTALCAGVLLSQKKKDLEEGKKN